MYKVLAAVGLSLFLTACSSSGGYSGDRYTDAVEPDYSEDEEVYTLEEAEEILYDEIYEEGYQVGYDEGYEIGIEDHTTEISDQLYDVMSGLTTFEDFVNENQ
jgi:flagellar biosynthesis/type III secretory pathway protein FliH